MIHNISKIIYLHYYDYAISYKSEYDQELPHPQTADQRMALRPVLGVSGRVKFKVSYSD